MSHINHHDSWRKKDESRAKNKAKKRGVYCLQSQKAKKQFATREEADLYIRYNHEKILMENGYGPIRSYFCDTCNCYHTTSKEVNIETHYRKLHKKRDKRYEENVIKVAYRKEVQEIKEILHKINRFVNSKNERTYESEIENMARLERVMDMIKKEAAGFTQQQLKKLTNRLCLIEAKI